MNLIALLAGLLIERLITNLLHLREAHWFDRYFDWGLQYLKTSTIALQYIGAIALIVIPVLPVLLISLALADVLFVAHLIFAIIVLLFSLGPRDLGEEVNDYCVALAHGDQENANSTASELLEADAPSDPASRQQAIEEAIFVQANNRIFGVVFWFMLLGPTGAWLFRVGDLMRRRAVHECAGEESTASHLQVIKTLHGLLAWIPARLLAVGYAFAGSFEDAVTELRKYYQDSAERFFDVSDDMLACVGRGALVSSVPSEEEVDEEQHAARSALRLVERTLLIWLFVIALMTLIGWTV